MEIYLNNFLPFSGSSNDLISFLFLLCPRDNSQGALRFARLSVRLSVCPFVTLYGIEFV